MAGSRKKLTLKRHKRRLDPEIEIEIDRQCGEEERQRAEEDRQSGEKDQQCGEVEDDASCSCCRDSMVMDKPEETHECW
ncbi:unnamed protein product [Cochlearia groenlandica]